MNEKLKAYRDTWRKLQEQVLDGKMVSEARLARSGRKRNQND